MCLANTSCYLLGLLQRTVGLLTGVCAVIGRWLVKAVKQQEAVCGALEAQSAPCFVEDMSSVSDLVVVYGSDHAQERWVG